MLAGHEGSEISALVLDFDCRLGGSGGRDRYQSDKRSAGIVGLALLLDVWCAGDDRRRADLRLPGTTESRHDWLCALCRPTNHDGSQNGRRIDAAAGNYLHGNYWLERRGSRIHWGVPGKANVGGSGLAENLHTPQLRVRDSKEINRLHAHFLFFVRQAEIPDSELSDGFPSTQPPMQLPECRPKAVCESRGVRNHHRSWT